MLNLCNSFNKRFIKIMEKELRVMNPSSSSD